MGGGLHGEQTYHATRGERRMRSITIAKRENPRGRRKVQLAHPGQAPKDAPLLWQRPGKGVPIESPSDGLRREESKESRGIIKS